jgi:hypothetical protein
MALSIMFLVSMGLMGIGVSQGTQAQPFLVFIGLGLVVLACIHGLNKLKR